MGTCFAVAIDRDFLLRFRHDQFVLVGFSFTYSLIEFFFFWLEDRHSLLLIFGDGIAPTLFNLADNLALASATTSATVAPTSVVCLYLFVTRHTPHF